MGRVHVHVLTARGHGPNSLLPHEEAWCEVWIGTNESKKVETRSSAPSKAPLWDEAFELDLGSAGGGKGAVVGVRVRGRLAGHAGIDDIGVGSCAINEVSKL